MNAEQDKHALRIKPVPVPYVRMGYRGGVCFTRLHVGVCIHGGLHQADISSHSADCRGLQSGREHRLQIPGGEQEKPGARPVLRERLSRLQRSEVGLHPFIC